MSPIAAKFRGLLPALFLFSGACCLYAFCAAREPLPGDVSVYLRRAQELNLDGFAQTHSLFLVLTHGWMRVFSFLPAPFAASLLSGFFGAVTVILVYLTVRSCGTSVIAALAGAGSLAVSHTHWFHSVLPEVYSLNAAFTAAVLYFGVAWWLAQSKPKARWCLCAMVFLGALGCANHMLMGMTLAVCLVWVCLVCLARHFRKDDVSDAPCSPRLIPGQVRGCDPECRIEKSNGKWTLDLLLVAFAGALGLLPLVTLVVRDAGEIGLTTALKMAMVGGSGVTGESIISYGPRMATFDVGHVIRGLIAGLIALLYNFPSPAILLLVVGVLRTRAARSAVLLMLGVFLCHATFATTYAIHESWAFLHPAWVACSVLIGLGADALFHVGRRVTTCPHSVRNTAGCASITSHDTGLCWVAFLLLLMCLILPPMVYSTAPSFIGGRFENKAEGRILDGARYAKFYLWPPKRWARQEGDWMREILRMLPNGAVVALRPGYRALAMYLQSAEHRRSDLKLKGLNAQTVKGVFATGRTLFTDASDPGPYLGDLDGWKVADCGIAGIWMIVPEVAQGESPGD